MSEQDYINVRDLSNIMHAIEMLRGICAPNQPIIPEMELSAILDKLYQWQEQLFAIVQNKP